MAGKTDLAGKRYGKLTVEKKTDQRKDRYVVWLCRCECGGHVFASTKELKNGTVSDCGCTPKRSARKGNVAEDLTGQKFGYLTVIKRTENKNGRTCWICRCDCGKEKAVSARDLKAGKVKSCGCRSYIRGHNRVELRGRRFGRLLALYPTEKRDGKGSVYWHCKCDCGNETELTEAELMHSNYRSCGCLKAENQKKIADQLHRIDGTCVEILEKRKYRRDNTSGFRGVFQLKNGRFRADIGFQGKRIYLGTYETFEEAVHARMEAEHRYHDGFLKAYYEWKNQAETDPEWAKNHPFQYSVK